MIKVRNRQNHKLKKFIRFRNTMKKYILSLLIAFAVMFAYNANAEQNTYDLEINVPAKVHVFKGDSAAVAVRTTDEFIYNMIDYTITDSSIVINLKDTTLLEYDFIYDDLIDINIEVPADGIKNIKTNSNLLVAYTKTPKATNNVND